jgi:hypothetical protein
VEAPTGSSCEWASTAAAMNVSKTGSISFMREEGWIWSFLVDGE